METNRHTWRTRQEIEVCPDCIEVGNGCQPDYEGYADSGHSRRYAQAIKNWGDEPSGDQHCEPLFSWHACEFCGDKLGGSRYTASLMQLHEEESVS